ncbi:hypothetical protein ALI22I_11340 [Saccharothrix sp. ALI-22-I]|uniref:hypothetical protein n=1 Tax=Saccharothrix sp. ALI-22-I TaxID=1933778 RepID=UPI00097C0263|nr:hypothetical protein [Saccharothrix sp. ALI-22-I]ONI90767.1 hypothetical protein ALI22I_11340 [Saccharothrix sp. ALI-22-I]
MSRKLLVWLHVVTSTGWMFMALALFVVVDYALSAPDRLSAFDAAVLLDVEVLQFMATTSAFSGLMLSGLTVWGYFRHWWVLAKFVITFTQLYVGIFVLSPNLHPDGSPLLMRVGSLLMASALACQVWLSVAKPFKRTPWASPTKPKAAPPWGFALCLAVPAFDYVFVEFVLGRSIPALSMLIVVVYPIVRAARRPQARGTVRV